MVVIHSTIFLTVYPLRGHRGLDTILAVTGPKAGYTLDWSLVHHWANTEPNCFQRIHILEDSIIGISLCSEKPFFSAVCWLTSITVQLCPLWLYFIARCPFPLSQYVPSPCWCLYKRLINKIEIQYPTLTTGSSNTHKHSHMTLAQRPLQGS